ncbi:MAG: hypothetical protein RLY86_3452 [Pseudomonadota bacterium]|jgi:ATP-dependent 26S proteasome regulatory subunit
MKRYIKVQCIGANSIEDQNVTDYLVSEVTRLHRQGKIRSIPSSVTIEFEEGLEGPVALSDSDSVNKTSKEKSIFQRNSMREDEFRKLVQAPRSNASILRLPQETLNAIHRSIQRADVRETVYDQWGLSSIDPYPRLTLNFAGPPGTGKTLCAHYIAARLNKKILEASYADVVSKYFGEGSQNLAALFKACEREDAILFIDEAETLLSRRSRSTDGADQAMNSMRSQLLILIEKTPIICVFSTNLIEHFDDAFLSRIITIPFTLPSPDILQSIWQSHLPENLPLAKDVTSGALADRYPGINGRQVARIVIEAAHHCAIRQGKFIDHEDINFAYGLVVNESLLK